jgi:hypothetical protein
MTSMQRTGKKWPEKQWPEKQRPDRSPSRPARQRAAHEANSAISLQQQLKNAAIAALSVCLLGLAAAAAHAQRPAATSPSAGLDAAQSPLSPEALRGRQELQQRARDLARELVGNILDMQLKQLEQNGLQKLEIYRDIQSMRKDIDALIDADMRGVVESLSKAQQADPNDRAALFTQVRGKIREIVTRLAVERQNLARRLRVAELAAQVRSLIEKQTAVRNTTETLTDQARQKQVELTLSAIQDQRDIKSLFVQLVNALTDVSSWGGEVGAGAADGLRILKAGQAGKEVDNAGTTLESSRFPAAAKSQQTVINALKALLDKLEGLQGLIGSSNEEALALVRELEKRQAELRKETKETDLQDPAADKLVDRQAEIRRDLSKLNAALEKLPVAQTELEQAKAAAYAATGNLFDAKQAEAVDQQTKALANLAEIEHHLQQASDRQTADKSAAELDQQLQNLELARQQVAEAAKNEQQAAAETEQKPQEAAAADRHAADALTKAAEPSPLPSAVKSRLEEAKAAAQEAANADEAVASPAAKAAAQAAANEALERAAAEVAAAINDTRLDQKAISAGELSRAAEALERAAAAEKQLAKETAEAANDQGLTTDQAKKLVADQAEVKHVAEKVAEGVKDRAADAAAALDAARQPINDAGHDLVAAEKHPGEATKPAAADAAQKATAAAHKLADAAANLRNQVAKEAGELATIAEDQLKPVVERRQDVEALQAKQTESRAAALEKLKEAERKVTHALAQEQRAEGRGQAAAAKELAQKIADVADQQKAADNAARQLTQGKTDSSFEAATAEQKVAEAAADVNKQAAARPEAKSGSQDTVARALEKAQQAAAEAAKQTVAGSPQAAEAARQAAAQALAEAQQAAEAESRQAAQAPAGQPDADAQKAVGHDAADARKLTADAAPKAGESLARAGESSDQAEKALAQRNQLAARQAQQAAASGLEQAAKQIAGAKNELAKQQAGEIGQHAGELGQLAKKTAPVDPNAASALHEAEASAAQTGQTNQPQGKAAAEQGTDATAAVRQGLQQADASLAARQQRLETSKQLAQQIASDAATQQQARNEIIANAGKLSDAAAQAAQTPAGEQAAGSQSAGRQNAPPATPAERSAAQALKDAEQRFAQAQSRIGENAQQVSGQTEVANKPIREGLEAASQLGQTDRSAEQDASQPSAGQSNPRQSEEGQSEQAAGEHARRRGAQALGTGLVPNAPEATAQQIAGPQATAQAARAGQEQRRGTETRQGSEPGQDQKPGGQSVQGQGGKPDSKAGNSSPVAAGGTGIKSGQKTTNVVPPRAGSQAAQIAQQQTNSRTPDDAAKHDAATSARSSVQEAPWLAKLPPEMRNAIRAKAHPAAPKVYEDRLKDYFETTQDGK